MLIEVDKAEESKHQAAEAQQLLDHPLIKEAFASLERRFHQQWLDAPIENTAKAERLRMMAKLLRSVRAHFEAAIQGGKFAEHLLEEQKLAQTFDKLNNNFFTEE